MENTASRLRAIQAPIHGAAMALWRRYRGLVDRCEAIALADLAALEAWRTRPIDNPQDFARYAVVFVRGRILRHVRHELRHRAVEDLGIAAPHGAPPTDPETGARAREALATLTPSQRELLVRHACGGDSLAQLAREANRHRAWGSRTLRDARRAARAGIMDSPCPPGSRRR